MLRMNGKKRYSNISDKNIQKEIIMEVCNEALFERCCREISSEYKKLGYHEGYRFLLCPKKLFNEKTKILFLEYRPGTDKKAVNKRCSQESCEHGCAFFSEQWHGKPRGQEKLQKQIAIMMEYLKDSFGVRKDPERFANENVLSAYFMPFRISDFLKMTKHEQKEAVQASCRLWSHILDEICPEVIMTSGRVVEDNIKNIMEMKKFNIHFERHMPSGWKRQDLNMYLYEKENRKITLGAMPNLSRFGIFGRDGAGDFMEAFMRTLIEFHAGR